MPRSFRETLDYLADMPRAAWVLLAAALIELGFAFVMQYGFGYEPCILCLWQRVPYAAVIALALLASLPPLYPYARELLGLCGLIFLIGVGLAVFHTGVERHWWLGTSGCAVTPLDSSSVEDLRTKLLQMTVVRCDQISWKFLGLSMANWNIPDQMLLDGFSLYASKRADE